jgi:hypothetical protein
MAKEPIDPSEVILKFKNASDWYGAGFYAFVSCSQAEAEEKLGIVFPRHYLDLMSELKKRGVPLQDILEEHARSDRASWPHHLVPFFQDGGGNYYCFDTKSSSAEYPVVLIDHELSRDENLARMTVTDASFAEWSTRYARDEIPDQNPLATGKFRTIGCLLLITAIVFLAAVGIGTILYWIKRM